MILDLILIGLFLIIAFIGYKVGFLTTLIKIASGISGLIIAILLVRPTTNLVTDLNVDRQLENKIYSNITTSDAFVKYNEYGEGEEGLALLINELGIPKFLAKTISHKLSESIDPEAIALTIADSISYAIVSVIVFFALLLLSWLLFFILKKIIEGTRKKIGFIRVLDGIAGIGFVTIIYILLLYIFFCVIYLILPSLSPDSGFVIFMTEQLHLTSEEFGIAKYIYEENIIRKFFELIF